MVARKSRAYLGWPPKGKEKKEKVSKRKNIYINQVKIIIIKIYLAGRVDE